MPRANFQSGEYSGRETLENLDQAENYNKHLANLVTKQLAPASEVLDFGAGRGTFMRLVSQEGHSVTGIELDEVLQGMARATGFHVVARAGDLSDGKFDAMYSLNVFEHIEDDALALTQLISLLKPGAQVIIYVPAHQHLYSKFDAAIGHHRRYTRRDLKTLGSLGGLKNVRITYEDPIGYLAAVLFKILRRSAPSKGAILLFDKYLFPLSRLLTPFTRNFIGKNLILRGNTGGGDGGI